MCGIVAYLTPWSNGFQGTEVDTFTDMLFLDTLRGWDSTGVFGVENNGNVSIAKEASHGANFIRTHGFREIRTDMVRNGIFFVGHNRAATRGQINDKNAHPFWVSDKIVLVQNGTMRGDHKKHKDVEVDTEALTHVLAETDDVEEALNKIDAAYALIWYNVKNKSLNIIRNDERPLYFAECKDGGVLWASEPATILYAAHRNSKVLEAKPAMLEKDTLVTYKLNTNDRKWEEEITEIKIKPKVYAMGGYSNENFHFCDTSPTVSGEDTTSPFAHGHEVGRVTSAVLAHANARQAHIKFNGPKDVEFSFVDAILSDSRYKEYYRDVDEAKETFASFEPSVKGKVLIQLIDYIAANNNPDCEIFHVFGTDVEPGGEDIVYHWLEHKKELDVLSMVTNESYYLINPCSLHMREFTISGTRYALLTSFGMQPTRVREEVSDGNKNVH